jgi:hypothetical protein
MPGQFLPEWYAPVGGIVLFAGGVVAFDGVVSDAAGDTVVLVPAAYVTAAPPASDAAATATARCLRRPERIVVDLPSCCWTQTAHRVHHRPVMVA